MSEAFLWRLYPSYLGFTPERTDEVEEYDLIIQLGSQVKFNQTTQEYELAAHTEMRTMASAHAVKNGITDRLMICGGSNFGIRYNDTGIMSPADFSFAAYAKATEDRKSESEVIKEFLVNKFYVASECIFTETMSATTEENALFAAILLQRKPAFTETRKVGVLSLFYHLNTAFPLFRECFAKIAKMLDKESVEIQPVFAENILAQFDPEWIPKIHEYYCTPKGGKQYHADGIRDLLESGTSLIDLM